MNNPFPQEPEPKERTSTHLPELYGAFVGNQLDTIRDHQQMIGLYVSVKETAEYYGETWQRANVYLKEEKIYLERAVKELAKLRETAERFSEL